MYKKPCLNKQGPTVRPKCCCSCLSSERRLQCVPSDLRDICNGISFSAKDKICYECRAILNKTLKFKKRAEKAKNILCSLQLKSMSKKHNIRKSLSTLTISNTKNMFDAECEFFQEKNHKPLKCEEEYKPAQESENISMAMVEIYLQSTEGAESDPALKVENQDTTAVKEEIFPIEEGCNNRYDDEHHPLDSKDYLTECILPLSKPTSTDARKEAVYYVKTFSEAEMLDYREEMKRAKTYRNRHYKCEMCITGWNERDLWVKHNVLHDEESGPYLCRVCKQRFPLKDDRDKHVDTHYRYYECCQCTFRHNLLRVVTVHVQRSHTEHECKICNSVFTNFDQLKRHELVHRQRIQCNLCDKTLASAMSYGQHMRRHKGLVPLHECAVCHKQLSSSTTLRSHIKLQHAYNPAVLDEGAYCVECEKQFKSKQHYATHLKKSLRHAAGKYECAYCGKRCPSKYRIQLHIEISHLKIPRYECEACKQKFVSPVYLKRHAGEHGARGAAARRHVCHVCGNKFTTGKTLRDHLNSHYGLRPHECNICGDTFSYHAALFNHNKLVHLKQLRPGRKKKTG